MIRFLPGGTWPVIATDASGALFSLIVTVIGVVAVAILVGRLYPRLPVLRHLVLEQAVAQHEGYAASSDTEPLVGRTGRALNDLRPAGTAVFDDRRLDVVSLGDCIQTGRMVRIVQAHGSRIVVEAVPDSDVGTES
jgi:membrane-bound serine protease (ClpP class)